MKFKRTFILLLAVACPLWIYSQKAPECKKKIYVSPEGKVYVQKALPVYLKLYTHPNDSSNGVTLRSESTAKYTNPFYFDTEGFNSIRSPWCVDTTTKETVFPKQDIVFEVYADSKPPVTSISFGDLKTFKQKNRVYINGKAKIKLSAVDLLSGVDKIMYSIDSSEYAEYKEPLSLGSEKAYILKYYSYDNVGNVEPLNVANLYADYNSPKTSAEFKGDVSDSILSGRTLIILHSEDSVSKVNKILIKLDDSPEQSYTGPINTAFISEGEHKLFYRSVDNVDNFEPQHIINFYVDKTPPTIMHEVIGKSFMVNGKEFSSGHSILKFTTIDNKAGVKELFYSINNSKYEKYEKPVTLNSISGNMGIKAYALDKVNNRSYVSDEAQSSSIPYIDLSGPIMDYHLLGPVFKTSDTIYVSSKTKVVLNAKDLESGLNYIQYKIDNDNPKTYSASFSIEQEGFHKIEYTGYDNVDNTTTANFSLMVDNSGPIIYPRFSTAPKGKTTINGKSLPLYPPHVVLFIAATDLVSGYDYMTYSINGSKEKRFTGYLGNFFKDNEVVIKAYDKLGNESVTKIEFGIKY